MTASAATKETGPSGGHVVLVMGMHRSGLSAVTDALSRLGLHLPRGDDPREPIRGREPTRGRCESVALLTESDEALARLGGSWDTPPPIPRGAAAAEELSSMLERARRAFAVACGEHEESVCWTDPRTALLLPFWRQVIDRPMAAVLCLRHPLEAARSLEERAAIALPVGLALFERYLRSAVAGLDGLPVFVSDLSDAVADPGSWGRDISSWLDEVGIVPAGTLARGGSELPFEDARRHFRDGDGPVGLRERRLAAAQQELYDELLALRGPHRSFRYEPVSAESIWTTSVTLFEIRTGLELLPSSRRRRYLEGAFERMISEDLDNRVMSFDSAAANAAGSLVARRQHVGRSVAIRDAQIAGIALARKATVATRNTRHFTDLGVRLVDPWSPAGGPKQ